MEVPDRWAALPLRSVCAVVRARVWPDQASGLPYVGLEHIVRDTHALAGFGGAEDTTSLKALFKARDVLYGRLRPNLNKVVVAPWDGIASTDIIALRANALIEPDYLLNILASVNFTDYAVSHAKGTNLPRLAVDRLLDFVALIPPVATQRDILDALGARLTGLGSVREKIRHADGLAAKAMPKILSAAVEGRLTRAWRQENSITMGAQASPIGDEESPPLPAGWSRRKVEDAGSAHTGRPRKPRHHQGDHMRPYLRVANVQEGRLDLTDVMTMNFTPAEFERFRLRRGDILVNEGQSLELVGRPAMFRGEMEAVAFTNTLIRFECGPETHPEFAEIVFRHYMHAGVFRAVAKISTNLAHLGVNRFLALPFPMPSLEEQRLIAKAAREGLDQLERARTMLAGLSDRIDLLIERLRSQALAGELITGDSDAEPVSSALDRLRKQPLLADTAAQTRKPRRPRMKTIRPLAEVLTTASQGLTGQALFDRAGYPEDATTDSVERFYLELRADLTEQRIERREVDGVERFFMPAGPKVSIDED